MNHGLNLAGARLITLLVWTARVVLVVYGILMISGYWSQLTDVSTTIRLVGSDVGCSLSAVDCNWLNFAIEKIVGVAVIGFVCAAQFSSKWRYRNSTQVGAAIVAIAHLIALQVLSNPS